MGKIKILKTKSKVQISNTSGKHLKSTDLVLLFSDS